MLVSIIIEPFDAVDRIEFLSLLTTSNTIPGLGRDNMIIFDFKAISPGDGHGV